MNKGPDRFPRSARILKAEDFQRVKKGGSRVRSGPVLVSVLPGAARRIGIIASRQTGKSNQRNRARRVVRELFRLKRGAFPVGDCVVVLLPGVAKLNNQQVREHIAKALEKLIAAEHERKIRE